MVLVYIKMCVTCKPREYGEEKGKDTSRSRREGNLK
jgi:hypothetical protein